MLMVLLFACICIYLQSNAAYFEGEEDSGVGGVRVFTSLQRLVFNIPRLMG